MRNGQNNKRMRNNNRNNNNNNNNNNNRRGQNPMTRVYESNGPDIKIRGTASHIGEKYLQLARDARSSGDPVAAENYYQHAEHYFRLIAAAQEQFRQNQPQQQQRADNSSDVQLEDGDDESESFSNFGAEPGFVPQQREQQQPRENYQPRGEQPYPRDARQPQPQYQPQPPAAPAGENIGLPSFITGGAPQPANAAPFEQNGSNGNGNGEQRFPPRRRRRPHGPRPDAAAAPAAVGEDVNPGNS
jgi:Domain of unknown function (DUF4167)